MYLAFLDFITYKNTLVGLITVDGSTWNVSEILFRASDLDKNHKNINKPFSGSTGKFPYVSFSIITFIAFEKFLFPFGIFGRKLFHYNDPTKSHTYADTDGMEPLWFLKLIVSMENYLLYQFQHTKAH